MTCSGWSWAHSYSKSFAAPRAKLSEAGSEYGCKLLVIIPVIKSYRSVGLLAEAMRYTAFVTQIPGSLHPDTLPSISPSSRLHPLLNEY
jgi:hypothetical protein